MAMAEKLHKRFHKDKNPEGMDFNDVQIYLQAAIAELKGKKEVYVLMDALDELPDDREGLQRAQMLKWITETSNRETHVHILFTSRMGSSCMDIEAAMKSQSRLFQVSIDTMTNRDDIRLYIEGQFRANNNLNKLKNLAQVNIIERLIGKSDGMFQWVSCQLDELKDLQIARSKDVEEVLNSMPRTLDECYMGILQGVNSRRQTEIIKALHWISLSFQPLSLEEVNEACIIDSTKSPAIKKEDQFSGEGIATLLSSFVSRIGDGKKHLSLSHFSVKEFFKSSTIQDSEYSKYGFCESGAHASIAESCIACIYYYSSCPMRLGTQSDLEYFPLLFYACRFWFEHLRLAEEEQERLAPFVIKFLTSWEVYRNALRIYNPLYPEKLFPCKIHTLASPLGWAAALGLEFLAERLLEEDSKSIDAIQDIRYFTQKHEETAGLATHPSIEFMCELCGGEEMPGIVVTQYANPIRGTALMKAVAHGHENLARLLIENGANVHVQEKGYAMNIESALSIACGKGNENMVRILLQGGADPNENCGGESALKRAIRAQSKSICEILLEKKAHVNESESAQYSPLMTAALMGDSDLCNLLLNNGADINWKIEEEAEGLIDALSIATRNGSVELVDLFLSRGSQIRPEALFGSLSAINMMEDLPSDASRYNRVCELLINGGADLNPVSEAFDTPLAMALHIEWYDIAKLMLSKGAQVHPDDSSCLTAGNTLVAAVKSLDMTREILDMGVDVNAQVAFVEPFAEGYDYDYRHFSSALQAAAFHHNRDVVKLLLNRNADPGITGPPYGSALYAVVGRIVSDQFVSSGDLSVAQQICEMLLAKGAELDRKYGPEDEERMAECMLGYRGLTEWQKGSIPLNTPLQLANGGNTWFQIVS